MCCNYEFEAFISFTCSMLWPRLHEVAVIRKEYLGMGQSANKKFKF